MPLSADWPSLTDEFDLAQALYDRAGHGLVEEWFARQVARTHDASFAREFSDHIDLPGVRTADYLHRRIRTSAGALLGGIRFYGRDISRPFVEVVAHSFGDLDRLRDCVAREWAMFTPQFLRVRTKPGRLAGADVLLDVSVYLARYCDMHPATTRVWLEDFADVADAEAMVAARYGRLDPALARNVTAASTADVRQWHSCRQLRAIGTADGVVGLLAVVPGTTDWIAGDVINEEVVDLAHRNHGYAAAGQAAWAAEQGRDGRQFLIGTIDRLNTASRKTAEAAGRRRVLDRIFVSTDPRAG